MAKKKQKSKQKSESGNAGIAAALVAGGLGLIVGLFALNRRSRSGPSGEAGAIDRALGMPSGAAEDGGSTAADLGLDQPHHSSTDRAAEDFRPDPTAPVSDNKRDAFAPATMPNPNRSEPAM